MEQKNNHLWLYPIIILGAFLRFYGLSAESYWLDEIITLNVSKGGVAFIIDEMMNNNRPPLIFLFFNVWFKLFGISEAAARSLPAIVGTVSIILVYALGRELLDRKTGLLSSLFMSVSVFQIYHAQELRYYSFLVLFTLMSYLCYIRMMKSKGTVYLVMFVIFNILLLYTHTFGLFVLFAQNLHFLFLGKNRPYKIPFWTVIQFVIILVSTPILLVPIQQALAGNAVPMRWISDPPLWLPVVTLGVFLLPCLPTPTWINVAAAGFFLLFGTLSYILILGKRRWVDRVKTLGPRLLESMPGRSESMLLVLWLFCPILLPLLLSKILAPMYIHRYTLMAAPAFYLILAWAVPHLSRLVSRFVLIGLFVILIIPGLCRFYEVPTKEQWREVAGYLEKNAGEKDALVIIDFHVKEQFRICQRAFSWYYRGHLRGCGITYYAFNTTTAFRKPLEACISGHDRFWLILRREFLFLEPLFLDPKNHGMTLIEKRVFVRLNLYLFAKEGREAIGKGQ
jgi:uncharacterized membrane protein